jgi:predicted flap endonuclease-1-like 5' DNA nuclease
MPLQPAVPVRSAPAAQDNLRRINGITFALEERLAALGVTTYAHIASWSPADVERFDHDLGGEARISRENWVEQAQILSRGGDTSFSRAFDRGDAADEEPATAEPPLADAEPPDVQFDISEPVPPLQQERVPESAPPVAAEPVSVPQQSTKPVDVLDNGAETSRRWSQADLGALRSVRSEAYQNPEPGPEAARRAATLAKVHPASHDDLKRIRGIGVLIEKRLNAMGVFTYEQIANWTAQDIDRVSQTLDFKGRIERENWIEQARILASGGVTEFSRRVDRGDPAASRYKT